MKKLLFFASAVAMLASCSKDITEDLAPAQVKGKSTIYASYEDASQGDATRTEATLVNGVILTTWNTGDALGVFNAIAGDDANSAFYYASEGEGSTKGEFKGDFDFLGDNEYVGYYPWERDAKISDAGDITLVIPAEQNYRFNPKSERGSFANNVAPAVAYGKASETGNSIEMDFYAAASYMYVPFTGDGTVKTLKLEIDGVALSGDITVNIDDLAKGDLSKVTLPTDDSNNTITIKCGTNGVPLDKETATYFFFVIPGNLTLENATVKFYVNDDTKAIERILTKETTPGNAFGLAVDSKGTPFNWIEGAEGAYVISTPEQFLKYAYVATYGWDDTAFAINGEANAQNAADKKALFDDEGKLRRAIFAKDIDMTKLGKVSDKWVDVEKMASFEKAVLFTNYELTENTIATIGGKNTFEINGKGYKLENLTVKGNGMFFDGGLNYQPASVVKNLTFSSVKVNAKGVKNIASFLLARLRSGDTSEIKPDLSTAIENVTIDANCSIEADANVKTTIIGDVHAGGTEISFEEAKIVNNTEIQFADHLYVMGDLEFDETISVDDFNTILVNKYGNVNAGGVAGAVVTVADGDAAKAFIAKEAISRKAEAGSAQDWYSVIDANQTSYWTGLVATAPRGDKYFTAEELAYVVANGNTETAPVVMTNHITLLNKEWTAAENIKVYVKNTKNYYISDVKSTNSLFGDEAYVENVTIDKIAVATPYMLAKTGTAKNTTIKGGVFDIEDEVDVVGGLFFEAEADVAAKTTGCQVKASNVPADAAYGALYGKVGIDLGHQIYTFPATAKDAYGVFDCYSIKEHEGHDNATNIVFTGTTELPNAKAIVKWNTAKGPIGANHTVFILTKAEYENEQNTLNYTWYDGQITDSESFATAITTAEAGDTIKLAAGVYEFPDIKDVNDNVTIVCAPGTKFESVNMGLAYRTTPNGHTYGVKGLKIVGAEFVSTEDHAAFEGYISNNTFEDCVFDFGTKGTGYGLYPVGGTTTFKNCQFKGANSINVQPAEIKEGTTAKFVFDDCSFEGWVVAWGNANGCMSYEFKNACSINDGGWFAATTTFDGAKFAISEVVEKDSTEAAGNKGIILESKETAGAKYTFKGCTNNGAAIAATSTCIVKKSVADANIKFE